MKAVLALICLIVGSTSALTNLSPAAFTVWLHAAPGVSTSAIGACVVQYDSTAQNLGVVCHHNISSSDSVTAAHIHGPVANPLTDSTGPLIVLNVAGQGPKSVTFNAAVTPANLCNMYLNKCYLNVHTTSQSGGLIRGSLVPTGSANGYTHTAILDNVQAKNGTTITDSGVGLIKRSGSNIWVSLFHSLTVLQPVGEHIHNVSNGNVIYSICGAGGGPACSTLPDLDNVVNQQFAEVPALAGVLDNGGLYFNVHTAANPGGKIRGGIMKGAPITGLMCASGFMAQASLALVALLAMLATLLQ